MEMMMKSDRQLEKEEHKMAALENQGHRSGCALAMVREGKPCWCGRPYKDGRKRRGSH